MRIDRKIRKNSTIESFVATFYKLKILSDVVLLLPCTDLHQQVEDCVRRFPPTMY